MEKGTNSNGTNQPSSRIVLAIKSQDGDTIYYRVERDKKIRGLLTTYCKAKNFKYHDVAFIHNGTRIQSTKTLMELGIADGDEIDAMMHQNGGGQTQTLPSLRSFDNFV